MSAFLPCVGVGAPALDWRPRGRFSGLTVKLRRFLDMDHTAEGTQQLPPSSLLMLPPRRVVVIFSTRPFSVQVGYKPFPVPSPRCATYLKTDGPLNQPTNQPTDQLKVAMVEYHNVTEGRYVCANGGNCTSPGVCECAAGWSGFDCRTPICSQARQIKLGVALFSAGSAVPPEPKLSMCGGSRGDWTQWIFRCSKQQHSHSNHEGV